MTTFAESARTFLDTRPGSSSRVDAWSAFSALGLPTTVDEVWRYAPLGDLDLDRFALASQEALPELSTLASDLAERAGLVIRIVDGYLVDVTGEIEGVRVEAVEAEQKVNRSKNSFQTKGGSMPIARVGSEELRNE